MSTAQKYAVIITGVGGGIGSALNDSFRAEGYTVIGLGRRPNITIACDLYIPCDLAAFIADKVMQEELFEQVSQYLAENDCSLKALINNAAYQVVKSLDALSAADFHSTLNINVIAPFILTKLFQKLLREAKGTVINVGSIHNKLTKPGFCAYSTSKSGLAGLTRAMALELAPDVTVNMVSPAATATEMLRDGFKANPERLHQLEECHPMGRIADPAEVAKVVLFLCSQEASFMTGSDISIDGGIGGRLHDPI